MIDREYGISPEEYSSASSEFSSSAPEYTNPESELYPLPEEYATGQTSVRAKKNPPDLKKRFNTFIVACLALTVTASVGMAEYSKKQTLPHAEPAHKIEVTPEVADEEPSQIVYAPAVETPAVTAEPEPEEEDPYEGLTDAEILLENSPWEADNLEVVFNPDGTGTWVTDDQVGVFDWAVEDDGSVIYDGYTYEIVEDDNELPYREKQIKGKVIVHRQDETIGIRNPFNIQSFKLSPSPGAPKPNRPGIYDWEIEPYQLLKKGVWVPKDDNGRGIQSITFNEDGTVTIKIEGRTKDAVLTKPDDGSHKLSIVNDEEKNIFKYKRQYTILEQIEKDTEIGLEEVVHEETIVSEGGIKFIINYERDAPEIVLYDRYTGLTIPVLRHFELQLTE